MEYRFVAKKIGEGRGATWRVYDRLHGSFPIRTPELGEVPQNLTQADAEAEVERLHAAHGGFDPSGAARKRAAAAKSNTSRTGSDAGASGASNDEAGDADIDATDD